VSISLETKEALLEVRRMDHELDRFILTAADYLDLVSEAYASNIHWSTWLEGNPLKEEEVARLTRQTFAGTEGERNPGPQQEIINHLYTHFMRDRLRLPWSSGTVRAVHGMLTEGTGTAGVPGEYRRSHASMIDQGAEAFIACPPEHIEEEMSSLLDWLNSSGQAMEPLVCSTVFFHEFESVHPFQDGNGRTGRTLFHLLLQESGMRNSNLCRIGHHLLRDPSVYYDLLAYADENGSYSEIIEYFALYVLEAYQEAFRRFKGKDMLTKDLDEGSIRLLQKAREAGAPFDLRSAAGWVEGIGEQTLRGRLNHLVEIGFLRKEGRTAATRYRFIDPFEPFKEKVKERGYVQSRLA